MKRSIDVKSVYGQLQRTGYEYIKDEEQETKKEQPSALASN